MEGPKLKKAKSDHCKVCTDHAGYSYFGAVVCESCKMFFKRYAENEKKTWLCKIENQCEVTLLTRHRCIACRLKKCFQIGMQAEKIRHTNRTNTSGESHITMTLSLIPRNDLVQSNVTRLTGEQWTLFGNLINSYDLPDLLQIAEQLNYESNQTTITSVQAINETFVREFLQRFYKEAGRTCRNNVDLQNLPQSDRSILLHTAAENVTCLAAIYVFSAGNLSNHRSLMNYLDSIYGSTLMQYHRWTTTYVHHDVVLFKLALALFSLSPTSRIFRQTSSSEYCDVKSIVEIEHKYASLTWEYLLYKYNFKEAVQRYIQMIRWFLAMNVFLHHAHSVSTHMNDMESLIEETELNLIMDDVHKIVEDKN